MVRNESHSNWLDVQLSQRTSQVFGGYDIYRVQANTKSLFCNLYGCSVSLEMMTVKQAEKPAKHFLRHIDLHTRRNYNGLIQLENSVKAQRWRTIQPTRQASMKTAPYQPALQSSSHPPNHPTD